MVRWPEAIDNTEVTAYSIYLNGQLVRRVTADQFSYVFSNLSAQESYEVVLIASDLAHNRSAPLAARYQLQDQTPPT